MFVSLWAYKPAQLINEQVHKEKATNEQQSEHTDPESDNARAYATASCPSHRWHKPRNELVLDHVTRVDKPCLVYDEWAAIASVLRHSCARPPQHRVASERWTHDSEQLGTRGTTLYAAADGNHLRSGLIAESDTDVLQLSRVKHQDRQHLRQSQNAEHFAVTAELHF